jgi:hypothetical protein
MVGLHPKGWDRPSVKRPPSFEKPRNVDAGDLLVVVVVDAVARVRRYPWAAVVEADRRRRVVVSNNELPVLGTIRVWEEGMLRTLVVHHLPILVAPLLDATGLNNKI